jgi:hypothetical protein
VVALADSVAMVRSISSSALAVRVFDTACAKALAMSAARFGSFARAVMVKNSSFSAPVVELVSTLIELRREDASVVGSSSLRAALFATAVVWINLAAPSSEEEISTDPPENSEELTVVCSTCRVVDAWYVFSRREEMPYTIAGMRTITASSSHFLRQATRR